MITALIRTHPGREDIVKRAIYSAEAQGVVVNVMECKKVCDFSYNLFANDLKQQVQDGFFFFLDSDDYVIAGTVDKVLPMLKEDYANIVQMKRGERAKPRSRHHIKRGYIGGPCLVLHSKHKDISEWTNEDCGDWKWVEGVIKQLPINFIPVPLVDAGKRSHGK